MLSSVKYTTSCKYYYYKCNLIYKKNIIFVQVLKLQKI